MDTAPDLIGTLNAILAAEGLAPLPLDQARNLIGRGAKALLEKGFAAAGVAIAPERMPGLFERFLEIYLGRIAQESVPFPGVTQALDRLAQAGATLAVCTNKRTDLSVALLNALGLTSRFAAVIGADLAPKAKPDASHLLTTIARAGGDPARALMVGDSASDAGAAQAAGAPVVLVRFGYTEDPVENLPHDRLISHYDELVPAALELLTAPRPPA